MSRARPMKAGDRFNMLVAIEALPKTPCGHRNWLFQCDCGIKTIGRTGHVRRGEKKSCGCLNGMMRATLSDRCLLKHGASRKGNKTPEYMIWCAMKERCANKNNRAFKNYGGRGISVEEPIRSSFEAFINAVGLRPSQSHSLERINNDGNYAIGNIRWATAGEQVRNRRPTIKASLLLDCIFAATSALRGGDVDRAITLLENAPRLARSKTPQTGALFAAAKGGAA